MCSCGLIKASMLSCSGAVTRMSCNSVRPALGVISGCLILPLYSPTQVKGPFRPNDLTEVRKHFHLWARYPAGSGLGAMSVGVAFLAYLVQEPLRSYDAITSLMCFLFLARHSAEIRIGAMSFGRGLELLHLAAICPTDAGAIILP